MSKHTPWPWVVKADEEIVYGTSHEGEHIVVVYELNTNEADAALIAAAPEMLAVALELERLMLVIESAVRHSDPRNHAAVMDLILANKAAVRKAVGAA